MAHELTETAGKYEMAYVGAPPWHGLGQKLEENASISTWIKSAGMDWMIQRVPLLYAAEQPDDPFAEMRVRAFDNREVFYRSDTLAPLGVATGAFQIVQPAEVIEFFTDLTEGAGFKMHTAGTLFGGKKFWALASIGEDAEIGENDKVGGFLLLNSSCDGSTATEARFTSVRVVCNNTLSAAINGKAAALKVSHRSEFLPSEVKEQLGIKIRARFGSFMEEMRRLAQTPVNQQQAEHYTLELLSGEYPWKMAEAKKNKLLRSARAERILELFNGAALGADLEGTQGRAWGYLNAVTQFVDHEIRAKSIDHRMDSAWFGNGAEMKTRALELLSA